MQILIQQSSPTASQATIREHQLHCDRPVAKGGGNAGPMGGEYFLMGLGGCFSSNLMAGVAQRSAEISNLSVTVDATLASEPSRFSKIRLLVAADYSDEAEMRAVIEQAEGDCIIVNTLKLGIPVNAELASRAP